MLKSMEKIKKHIWWMVPIGLFGIAGLLLAPVVIYIIKVSNHYPKVFRWIFFAVFVLLGVYGFLFEREWHTSFAIICIGAVFAVSSVLNNNSR